MLSCFVRCSSLQYSCSRHVRNREYTSVCRTFPKTLGKGPQQEVPLSTFGGSSCIFSVVNSPHGVWGKPLARFEWGGDHHFFGGVVSKIAQSPWNKRSSSNLVQLHVPAFRQIATLTWKMSLRFSGERTGAVMEQQLGGRGAAVMDWMNLDEYVIFSWPWWGYVRITITAY